MKLATYREAGAPRVGVVVGDLVHGFDPVLSMLEVVQAGLDAARRMAELAQQQPGVALADITLLAPLKPTTMRDFVTFEEHVEGVRRSIDGVAGVPEAWYDAPTFYFTNPHTVLGPEEAVRFPARSGDRDFELEVAAVLTGEGSSIPAAAAGAHIFGYTILNDWSARDLQRREMGVSLGPAKGKDFANSLGPWIVTADELDHFHDDDGYLQLWCTVSVNGEQMGEDVLANMGWTFEAMIAHASRDSRIVAGDVLGSGTTGNGGCLAELWGRRGRRDPPPLQPGDVVTCTVEGIGTLMNRVLVADPTPDGPAPRRRSPGQARQDVLASRPTESRRRQQVAP